MLHLRPNSSRRKAGICCSVMIHGLFVAWVQPAQAAQAAVASAWTQAASPVRFVELAFSAGSSSVQNRVVGFDTISGGGWVGATNRIQVVNNLLGRPGRQLTSQ